MLRNLGPKSCQMLAAAGITSRDQLQSLGPVLAYVAVLKVWPAASLNLLWALAAGLDDRDWRELTAAEKVDLRQQLQAIHPDHSPLPRDFSR
ncbi:competence-specific regulator [bacterium]|nr:competence-specific regulator [bacterium]